MAGDTRAHFCASWPRRNASPPPIDHYGRELRGFFPLVAKEPCTVSGRDVTACLAPQRAGQRAAPTITRRRKALQHCFAYWATDRQTRGSKPVTPSHVLRRGRPLPKGLAPEQVRRLLAQLTPPLDQARYCLMLRGGLRVSAVARVPPADLDWHQPSRRIPPGKGRQERLGSVAADALAALRPCGGRRPAAVPAAVRFWHQKRPQSPLSAKGLQKKRERSAKAADIQASGQSLRQTCAANVLAAGAAVSAIQALRGHASSQSRARSATLSNQRVNQAYQQAMRQVLAHTRL
jgi:site-specific recombinase XerD